jgi:hypothetical protein
MHLFPETCYSLLALTVYVSGVSLLVPWHGAVDPGSLHVTVPNVDHGCCVSSYILKEITAALPARSERAHTRSWFYGDMEHKIDTDRQEVTPFSPLVTEQNKANTENTRLYCGSF